MKRHIETTDDIRWLVHTFYDRLKEDETFGHLLDKIIKVDWDIHLKRMSSFWETMLFGKAYYSGNPLQNHVLVSAKDVLTENHFERWVEIWDEVVDSSFTGAVAENAKQKIRRIREHILFNKRQE